MSRLVRTLKKSAGVCAKAYGKRHVIMRDGPPICLLCDQIVMEEEAQ